MNNDIAGLQINNPSRRKYDDDTQDVNAGRPLRTKKWIVLLVVGIICLIAGGCCFLVGFLQPTRRAEVVISENLLSTSAPEPAAYSSLTGQPLAEESQKNAPTYCVQVPNGTDGARPQAGLTEAGVIFEAIAEAGITRFAAIYQNPSSAVIGPIRSLRIYYLDWDTPFNCTIVHAGGAADALEAVRTGGYRDLSENYTYMYRGTNRSRLWNNLFTTASDLAKFGSDHGYDSSNMQGFLRLTPAESTRERIDELVVEKLNIIEPTKGDTSALSDGVTNVNLVFGGSPTFNVHYDYDAASNTYKRSYSTGAAHEVYQCPDENLGRVDPEGNCNLVQMSPSIVIAMVVDEKKAADRYHESIKTVDSGKVYIFQNGIAKQGTWTKTSRDSQIKFFDDSGNEIPLAPGQTFISAIPGYGGVEY